MWRIGFAISVLSLLLPPDAVNGQISRPRSTPAAVNEQIAALSSADPASRALAAPHERPLVPQCRRGTNASQIL